MAKQRGEDPAVLHRNAQLRILSGLAAGEDDVFELMLAVRPCDVPYHFTPDVALLEVAAAALGLACPPGRDPLEYEGPTDRYLSDLLLTGRTLRRRTQYAIYAAACLHGGLLPDLLGEAGAWQPRLWTYAVSAVVLYVRAAADRLGQTVPDIAERIADHLGPPTLHRSPADRVTEADQHTQHPDQPASVRQISNPPPAGQASAPTTDRVSPAVEQQDHWPTHLMHQGP